MEAEREGFEPPDPRRSTVFKTAAIDRSAISPSGFEIAKVLFFAEIAKYFLQHFVIHVIAVRRGRCYSVLFFLAHVQLAQRPVFGSALAQGRLNSFSLCNSIFRPRAAIISAKIPTAMPRTMRIVLFAIWGGMIKIKERCFSALSCSP